MTEIDEQSENEEQSNSSPLLKMTINTLKTNTQNTEILNIEDPFAFNMDIINEITKET